MCGLNTSIAKNGFPPTAGDPNMGGLSSGEKAALSRGQTPRGVQEDPSKQEGADKYMSEKGSK
jgi:hypothetical protein